MKEIDWTFDDEEVDDIDIIISKHKYYKSKKILCVRNQHWDRAHEWRSKEYKIVKDNPNIFPKEYEELSNNHHFNMA